MTIEFKLPDLGENIESGDIVSVMVKEGDVVQPNQSVVEIETDKAVIEVPSTQGGRVTKVHVKPGDTVKVGATILTLEPARAAADGESKPAAPPAKEAAPQASAKPQVARAANGPAGAQAAPPAPGVKDKPSPGPEKAKPAPHAPQTSPSSATTSTRQPAPALAAAPSPPRTRAPAHDRDEDSNGHSNTTGAPAGPAVRRLARELGVDLDHVHGTGPGGRITRDDVIAAVRSVTSTATSVGAAPGRPQATEQDGWGGIRRERMSKIRKTIAANMARSHSTIPHVTNFDDADITELERIRKGSMAEYVDSSVKLTMMAFVMKAVAHSLKLHPTLNASLDLEHEEIVYKDYVNLGVAVDTPRGLVVPVLRNVDRLTIPQIASSLTALAEKVKNSQQSLDDLRGGTFTISNLGAIGGAYSTPIINYPEVAILLVGRSRKLPVVDEDDEINIRLMMPLSLSYDHRLVDGAAAARFLNEVKNYLEVPGRLLLAP